MTETTTLDNFGQDAEVKYVNSSGTTTDDFQYAYDADGNVLYQDNLVDPSLSELFHASSTTTGDDNSAYDPLNRLTTFERGTLVASGNNGSDLDSIGTAAYMWSGANDSSTYSLDSQGNWASSTTTGSIPPFAGSGTNTATTTRANNNQNEVTENGSTSLTYDNNGNLLTNPTYGGTSVYNAWNEIVRAAGEPDPVNYTYDADGRQITRQTNIGNGATTQIFYDNQWQDIQENSGSITSLQYVWGLGNVDQLVLRDDNSVSGNLGASPGTGSSTGLGERLYAQQDANDDVTALTNTSGTVMERFAYDPYGNYTYLTASAGAEYYDPYSFGILFQGGRFDQNTQLYNFRNREYSPSLGRWMQQDPAGYVNGIDRYQLDISNPSTFMDPAGQAVLITYSNGSSQQVTPTMNGFESAINGAAPNSIQNIGQTHMAIPQGG